MQSEIQIKDAAAIDCRTAEGVTVGLIDALITLCRIIKGRELDGSQAVKEALKDLGSDEDFIFLCEKLWT